jgi:hypothetical protein
VQAQRNISLKLKYEVVFVKFMRLKQKITEQFSGINKKDK